ncbi:MAG: nucleotide exchange factor GrpE [Byssovorax sp.]
MTDPEVNEGESAVDAPDRTSLMRALRELEASQARVQQNAERVYDEKRRGLVLELLPVLDNLERTLAAAETASDPALVTGLRMVLSGLEGVLARYGVERVDATGERFDPALHEAVAAVPVLDPKLLGAVVQQAAPGYRFGGKVLRAAKVSVGVPTPAVHRPRPRQFRGL